ncbi:MAG TPA: DMT family transporter [Egibacteraceae bacterium]|nr:DMT family transporter [Egibacteraceae bacterium]
MIFFGAALYATGPVFVGASSVPGPVFSFWRLWLGVAVLGLATLVWRLAGGRLPPLAAWRWPLLAGLSFGTHQVLFMTAIKATSVTTVALIGTISPIIVAIAAVPLFGERMGARFRLWTVLAMAGAAVVVTGASTGPAGDLPGTVMAVLNVVFFAGFFLVSKVSRDHIPVVPFLLGVMVTAAIWVSLFLLATGQAVRGMDSHDYLYALAVAAGPGALGHFVMTWPLRYVAANVPPVVRLSQPVISGTLAWAFLGEAIGRSHVLGGALTLLGVAGAMLSPSGRELPGTALEEDEPAPELPG